MRILKWIGGVVLLLVLALGGLGYATMGGLGSPKDEPLPGLGYVVKDGYVSVGVVEVGGGKVALVDAGNDENGAAILAGLAAHNERPEDVVAILLTHGHPDHVAGAHLFPGARIAVLTEEAPYLAGERSYEGPIPRFFGAKNTGLRAADLLHDGDTLAIGDRTATVYAVPGHTAGSAAWLIDGVLFLGDSASLTSDGRVTGAPWVFSDSTGNNRASLAKLGRRLEGTDVRMLVTSHSGTATGMEALKTFAAGN